MQKITLYLKSEWSKQVAIAFLTETDKKLAFVSKHPLTGKETAIKDVRSVLVGKGFQNRIYYKFTETELIILDIKDIRKNPQKNKYFS